MSYGSGDRITDERSEKGVRPDLIGWTSICAELGVTEKTARRWEQQEGMPVTNWGPTQVAAYGDRLRAWAAKPRRRVA